MKNHLEEYRLQLQKVAKEFPEKWLIQMRLFECYKAQESFKDALIKQHEAIQYTIDGLIKNIRAQEEKTEKHKTELLINKRLLEVLKNDIANLG